MNLSDSMKKMLEENNCSENKCIGIQLLVKHITLVGGMSDESIKGAYYYLRPCDSSCSSASNHSREIESYNNYIKDIREEYKKRF